ncbi:MAG: hypothetical protein R3192_12565 [Woeseiaceae bacterium]|nr:hypothetical protein [Woeseiaceae bacterium]
MNRHVLRYMFVLLLLIASPGQAHDPLREDGGHDHHSQHLEHAAENPDLAEVRSLVTRFRETGNDTHLDKAWSILESAVRQASNDPETLVAAAFVAQSRHEFELAMQLLEQAQSIRRNYDESWLLKASIHLVRGESNEAAQACAQLRSVPPLVVLTCNARVSLVNGHSARALAWLGGVLRAVDASETPPDMYAWALSVAGDLAVATGDAQQARTYYQQSLELAERTQVRAALVDVLLGEGNDQAAWQALDAGTTALPLLVRRFIVAKRLDRLPALAPELDRTEREFEAWIAAEDWLHAREMARFYVDVVSRPDLARRLALINFGLQREPEDLLLEQRTRG